MRNNTRATTKRGRNDEQDQLDRKNQNPIFGVQVVGTILLTALTYHSLQPADLTSWEGVGQLLWGILTNPYLLVSCL